MPTTDQNDDEKPVRSVPGHDFIWSPVPVLSIASCSPPQPPILCSAR